MATLVEAEAVIRDLDLQGLDDAIGVVRLRALLDAKSAAVIGEVDHAGDWQLDGHASMAACLRNAAGVTHTEARRLSRRAEVLHDLPRTAEAWVDGHVAVGQVDLITAIVTDRTRPLFAEEEERVLTLIGGQTLRGTRILLRRWQTIAETILALDDPDPNDSGEPLRSLHLSETLDGRGALDGDLDPEALEVARAALRLAERPDEDGNPRLGSQRRADALVDILRWFLDHHGRSFRAGRHRPHLNLVVSQEDLDDEGLGQTLDGRPVERATIQQVACDSVIHRVLTDGSSILDYGRGTRTIPPAVYTSLAIRDRGCRFPGCDRPPDWCEGHHVVRWEDGGPTCLSNLVLLCSHHHHRIHLPGWQLKLLPIGTVEVTKPDGTTLSGDLSHRW